jgi:hypothetical protein
MRGALHSARIDSHGAPNFRIGNERGAAAADMIDMTDGVARFAAMIAALMLIKPIRSCGAAKKCW